ncbi:Rhomboid family protein [Candidatus Sulfopaludibacter sp. SbA3]|nr:Rhomboid family protein [Candidatus Sulfopaludibacter sp. SbA3]
MDSRRMCPHCRAFITDKDRVCPYCNERVGPRAIERRSDAPALGGLIPHARFTTVLIMLINFGFYLATTIYAMKSGTGDAMGLDSRTLVLFGAKYQVLAAGQWWRLVTAGFLHGGLLHILFNSWALFDVGAMVDEIYGTNRMLVIYFFGNVTGFFFSSVWADHTPSVGASAAICGLVGAMIALGVRHRNPMGDAIRGTFVRWAVYILIMGFVMSQTDNAAHIGGLAGGFGIGYLAGTPRYEGSPTEKLWKLSAGLCVLLTVVSFLMWYLWYARYAQIMG